MISVKYMIDEGAWAIILYERDMEISMSLEEAQHLTQELIKTFKEIVEIEDDKPDVEGVPV